MTTNRLNTKTDKALCV